MRLRIIWIGKTRDARLRALIDDYAKRLAHFVRFEVTELREQVALKNNLESLGEMSAGLAHEFKNAIATILGYAQMSSDENDLATIHGYAREIQKESQSLSTVVTDFLNFARPLSAAIQDWSNIDPSIMGTLFERGLDPGKRSQLGAHYTDPEKIMMIVNL